MDLLVGTESLVGLAAVAVPMAHSAERPQAAVVVLTHTERMVATALTASHRLVAVVAVQVPQGLTPYGILAATVVTEAADTE